MNEHRFPSSPVFYRRLDRSLPMVKRGEGVYLYDVSGRRYLDASGGAIVVNVGHGRQEVAQAMADQASRVAYAHGYYFTGEALEELCTELVTLLPEGLDKVYLVCGGAEATETAIKLARQYQLARGEPHKYRVASLSPSYHGNTLGALSVSRRPPLREPYEPLLADFPQLPFPNRYRCPAGVAPEELGSHCAEALERLLQSRDGESVAAFLAEPVGGSSSGAAVPPLDYLARVREICDRHNVLWIADEVLTGLGRTGRYFAVEHFDVVPDILLLGKGLSSGYAPAGAVVTTTPIVETIRARFGNFTHGFTFSHNPVVAATCRQVLAILQREKLVARAETQGRYLLESLRRLESVEWVGDIRGLGLLAAVELVADRGGKRPFPRARRLVEEVVDRAFSKGLIVYPATGCANGRDGDLVLLAPPFVVEESQIDTIVSLLEETLVEIRP